MAERKLPAGEQIAAVWRAIADVAAKEARRDLLTPGALYSVDARIIASVNGRAVPDVLAMASTSVGHDQELVTANAVNLTHLVAVLLQRFEPERREAIMAEIAAAFQAGGWLPDCSGDVLKAAESWLEQLRSRTARTVRGRVSTHYSITGKVPAKPRRKGAA